MRSQVRHSEISRFPLLFLLALVFSSSVHSRPQGNATAPSEIKEILAQAAQSRTIMDHQHVFRRLNTLNATDRKSALEQLIGSPNDDVAAEAARAALTEHDLDAGSLVASRIARWRPSLQLGVLQALAPLQDVFLQIPRRIVTTRSLAGSERRFHRSGSGTLPYV
jgi:hypothetical protein